MAIIKSISSRSIKHTLKYITQEAKTSTKLITGVNCEADTALMQMQVVKKVYGKTNGRSCFHYVQSFAPDEKVTPELVHQIGCELVAKCKKFTGFQAVIATHIDREHIHNHIVFNSVRMTDGKKMQSSKADLKALKALSDECCMQLGLTITEKGKTFAGAEREEVSMSKTGSYRVLMAAKNGNVDSWVADIAVAVLENKHLAVSREDFCERMNKAGIDVKWTDGRKNITFYFGKKKVRSSRLQEYFKIDFSKEGLESEFESNREGDRAAKEADKQLAGGKESFEEAIRATGSELSARTAELRAEIERAARELSESTGRNEETDTRHTSEEETNTLPLKRKTKLVWQQSEDDEIDNNRERDFDG